MYCCTLFHVFYHKKSIYDSPFDASAVCSSTC